MELQRQMFKFNYELNGYMCWNEARMNIRPHLFAVQIGNKIKLNQWL